MFSDAIINKYVHNVSASSLLVRTFSLDTETAESDIIASHSTSFTFYSIQFNSHPPCKTNLQFEHTQLPSLWLQNTHHISTFFQPIFLCFFSSFITHLLLSNNAHRGKTHCIDDLILYSWWYKNDCVHTMCYTSLLLGGKMVHGLWNGNWISNNNRTNAG